MRSTFPAGSSSPTLSRSPRSWTRRCTTACSTRLSGAADAGSVRGKDVTPFLLEYIHEHTGGASVAVNLDIVRGNCRLGADIARAWALPA